MKKIIDGAKYDTATAKCLGSWDNGHYGNDFQSCSETLYRTKSGKYFLHGEGGPMSIYAEWHGNSKSGGERILPYTRQEAMQWAEKKLDGDDYEEIFGEVDEGGEKEALNLLVSAQLKSKLWQMAEEKGLQISVLAEELILKAMEVVR